MKRVLFLSQLFPYPLDSGPKVRSYYVLRQLAKNYQVTLVAFTRPDDKAEALDHMREFCQDVYVVPIKRSRLRDLYMLVVSLFSHQPFVIRRDFVPEMARQVQGLYSSQPRYDVIHVDQLWMAQYALAQMKSSEKGSLLKIILDEHNACFQIFQRLAATEQNPLKRFILEREWRILREYEAQVCSQFDHVVTVSDEDRGILEDIEKIYRSKTKMSTRKNVRYTTIPICVDPEAVQPVETLQGSKNVVHMGTMFWMPNVEGVVWFAQNVWPQVVEYLPEARFTIVGKNPPGEVRELSGASLNGAAKNGASSSICVTGYVADPLPYLSSAGVFIVPLLSGSGMRVKILEAWRWGLPVVSTRIGAEGIQCQDGENILIADDAEQFAQAIIRVLSDDSLARRLRENGRMWVEQNYDWRKTYLQWEKVYENESYQ